MTVNGSDMQTQKSTQLRTTTAAHQLHVLSCLLFIL
jgi:hypothetical protein